MGGKQVEPKHRGRLKDGPGGRDAIDESTRRRCAERMRLARQAAGYDTIPEAVTGLRNLGWPRLTYQQLYNWETGKRIAGMDALATLIALGYPRLILFPDGLSPKEEARLARQSTSPPKSN
jgi:hypothetical protein